MISHTGVRTLPNGRKICLSGHPLACITIQLAIDEYIASVN